MSDMKCPFCQQELEKDDLDVQLFGCENQNCKYSTHYDAVGTKELWQELIRTRKALDVAVDALKNATEYLGKQEPLVDVMAMNLHTDLLKALEQITTLEQKEHFADASKKIEHKGE